MDGNYIVMAVTLVVWTGLFFFLMKLDKRIRKIEEKVR